MSKYGMHRRYEMKPTRRMNWSRFLAVGVMTVALAGCQDVLESVENKAEYPLPTRLVNKMKAHDQRVRSPIMMRIYKQEGMLEVWKAKSTGEYSLVKEYEICQWSGELGPKFEEGDRQAPEGFYHIRPHHMNPWSSYYLSFNMGFPNSFDRAHNRTGSNLMVHGACSSAGCYSMTDEHVLEIYAFAREAFRGGQGSFQVQAFPFRMTAENMAAHRDHEHFEFWQMLKVGYDHFELTKRPPDVEVCDGRYVFNRVAEDGAEFIPTEACPSSELPPELEVAYASYTEQYEADFAAAIRQEDKINQTPVIGSLLALALRGGSPSNTPAETTVTTVFPADAAVPIPISAPIDIRDTVAAPDDGTAAATHDGGARSNKTWWKIWKR